MSDESVPGNDLVQTYIDFRSNSPKDERSLYFRQEAMKQRFEAQVSDAAERSWDLPQLMVVPEGEYLPLLLEARELYEYGYFYSCVAMCGIVSERLVKDTLRASMRIARDSEIEIPSNEAFDQLERVEVSGIINFLGKAALLSEDASKAAKKLVELRNAYAHARGKEPQADAIEAIKKLHIIIEDTVSLFKNHKFRDGKLIDKSTP